jgi:hypothetical protein
MRAAARLLPVLLIPWRHHVLRPSTARRPGRPASTTGANRQLQHDGMTFANTILTDDVRFPLREQPVASSKELTHLS